MVDSPKDLRTPDYPAGVDAVPFERIIEMGNALAIILKYGLDVSTVGDEQILFESMVITKVLGFDKPPFQVVHANVISRIREIEPTLTEDSLRQLQKEADKTRRQMGVKI